MAEPTQERPIDGRLLRSTRTRAKIVDAIREIIAAGNADPSLEEVAARARVGLRTVYRHFEDLEGLHHAVQELLRTEVVPLLIPLVYEGSARERVETLVVQRIRVYEKIAPFRDATGPREEKTTPAKRARSQLSDALGRLSEAAVGSELGRLDRDEVVAFETMLSFEAWNFMRTWLGIGRDRSAQILVNSAIRLLQI